MKHILKKGIRKIYSYVPEIKFLLKNMRKPSETSVQKALQWTKNNELETGGIRTYTGHPKAYPEVTGYFVPTLIEHGNRQQAIRLLDWLASIQKTDGSFYSCDEDKAYTFDTAQVLRGFLAGNRITNTYTNNIKLATSYILSQLVDNGHKGFTLAYENQMPPESIHLYALPPLQEALKLLGMQHELSYIQNCVEYYAKQPDFLQLHTLNHFLAYEIDGLIDLGRQDLAMETLNTLETMQQKDGSLPAKDGAPWCCTTGLAQIAICWYKIGKKKAGDMAMEWLEKNQNKSGGFYGSTKKVGGYFPHHEISWATKFYLDAYILKIKHFFDETSDMYPESIDKNNFEFSFIYKHIKPNQKIADIGCGKGRFLKLIKDMMPSVHCTGVDISPVLLSYIPETITKAEGTLENIPLKDNEYDVVFAIEAIEHSSNKEAAIQEMLRILKPGGKIIIIDKQEAQWGRMETPSWERWPEKHIILNFLQHACTNVTATDLRDDKIFVAWQGEKI